MLCLTLLWTSGAVSPSGNRRLSMHSWVAYDNTRPVAFLAAELLARWDPPENFCPTDAYIRSSKPTMSFSTLVDPELWGNGYATTAKIAGAQHPSAAFAETFHASIRADNTRSLRAIAKVPGAQLIGTAGEGGYEWKHFHWCPEFHHLD
ncbi:GNAT family N-acetyltransferase [Nocardia aobensis]|uniref:GNAT family N-acetyltransferase n=1 Tax=Nocardia aobensis TaxID=257277 RepID=A0ABW6PFV0_9NOCA